ncbi:DUF2628 domain-containing protein [Neorhizobium sp. JUb45]|uniref:DUF2628 domain-containing protein n=1 Tax=unclassified Neorhizobium TaxID=2629175 RepID=UPI00104D21BB|nr:DUF2628 domain-containing protein [Neorhizobium sp. JUb45]TCQ99611.1 uncharacterized protein DUF2628 [Neorhizobium sp. JUb45]
MISYTVLTPPDGPDRDHASTLFVADRFVWSALLLPWIWLLTQRMWFAAFVVFVSECMAIFILRQSGLGTVGLLAIIAIHALVALEGGNLHIRHLIARGWNVAGQITAPDLATAEEMFFAGLPEPVATPLPSAADWAKPNSSSTSGWNAPALGLFDNTGAR